jgi:hypothetical protein
MNLNTFVCEGCEVILIRRTFLLLKQYNVDSFDF